jgi:integrase
VGEAAVPHLPKDLRPVATFGNITGWRKSEVIGLEWRNVDLKGGSVRLDVGTTKNGEGREFPITDDLRELLEAQRTRTDDAQRKTETIIPWVFHRNGRRIKCFRGAWKAACRKAGLPARLYHDFRRTAVRRSVRTAGLHPKLAMALSGHKTDSVFRRYDIISKGDLSVAASALNDAARTELSQTKTQTKTASVGPSGSAGDTISR